MLHTLFQTIGAQYSTGNLAAVESAARSILSTVPNDQASLQFLGLVYYRTGREDEAVRILDAEPPQPDGPLRFEAASDKDFLSRNGYSAVAACHVEATQPSPDLAMVWYDLGVVLSELGRPDKALHAFRSALATCPAIPGPKLGMVPIALDVAAALPASDGGASMTDDDE